MVECKKTSGTQFAQIACVVTRRGHHVIPFVARPSIHRDCQHQLMFGVGKSWLVDTGGPKDLARVSCSEPHQDSAYPSTAHTFVTAAGDAESEAKMKLESELIEGKPVHDCWRKHPL